MIGDARNAQDKALSINLDAVRYGTFAEIGAGQEVARWFFRAGKASSTVARTISAYDMSLSDSLYGKTEHFVSRPRLEAMLDREYCQLVEQLSHDRGAKNAFFAFADTVATHGSRRSSGGHGWLGVRFQHQPGAPPSEVIIHIEMLDAFVASQQETVGIVGVNLMYGAFTWHSDATVLIQSLMDGLDRRRVEIDMIKFCGPVFSGLDNRLMSLQLVQLGLTDAATITASGEVVQTSEVLHGRPVVLERGTFRPVTKVTARILDDALHQLQQDPAKPAEEPAVLMEMTLHNLSSGSSIDPADFLARADMLGALGKNVMISNYSRFDRVICYLRQYTKSPIGLVVGVPTLRSILEEHFYEDLEGGLLEGIGRLFQGRVRVLVYPTLSDDGEIETADKITIEPHLQHLYEHLLENGFIVPVTNFSVDDLNVSPPDVLSLIQSGNPAWTAFVPDEAVAVIKREHLFGWHES